MTNVDRQASQREYTINYATVIEGYTVRAGQARAVFMRKHMERRLQEMFLKLSRSTV